MKKRTSILCLLLAILTLLPLLAACDKDSTKTPESTTQAPQNGETMEDPYLDDLGSFDFNGDTVNVLSVTSTDGTYTLFDTEELGGTVLDDSLYERNREIEERFNLYFEASETSYKGCNDQLSKQALGGTGENDFDMIMLINRDAYSAALRNELLPVSKMKYIDQSKDYYLKDINDAMTFNGYQFLCYTEESLYTFQRSTCIAYNKQVATDRGMGNFYSMVKNDAWTFEEMFKQMETVTEVNQDNEVTFYGLYGHGDYLFSTFYAAAGENYVTKTEDKLVFSAASNAKMDSITTTVLDKIDFNYMGYDYDYNAPDDCYNVFKEGDSLFVGTVVGKLLLLKDIEGWDYGVLPWPKYNEEQSRYYTRVVDAWLHVVPYNHTNPDMMSVLIEALAAGSSKYVFPAFYDIQIKGRSLRDPESVEMLEIVRSTRVIDWGGTVFATTIRSAVEKQTFVDRSKTLFGVCNTINTMVASLMGEARAKARDLAAVNNT